MRRYEFKVEYGCSTNKEKWTKFYVQEKEMNSFTIGDLDVRLRQKCGFPCAKIRYQDRALDWIDLNHDDIDSFIDMIETASKELLQLERSYGDAADAISAQAQSALCTKCHNSRHNRTQCIFVTCVSATVCGDIKRHPDKNNYLKDKREELKKEKANVTKIELDSKNKKETYKAVQNTFAAQVQTDIINSDPKQYLHSAQDDYCVPNWLLVKSDIRKLEHMCRGKIPPKSEIQSLLKNYNDILAHSRDNKSHGNPVRDLWKKKGVRFPCKDPLPGPQHSAKESAADILARNGLGPMQELSDESNSEEEYEGLNLLFRAATFLDNSVNK